MENEKHEYEALFVRQLEKYRQQKDVSMREMSLSIGQSPGYVAKLLSGHNNPKMITFYWICDYFHVTPSEFFDEQTENPAMLRQLMSDIQKLNEEQLLHISAIIKGLINGH
mgnify:CR=1 FL=1